jgi:hypothetical protein
MILSTGHDSEQRKHPRAKYPWSLLVKNGDYFEWGAPEDAQAIRASARYAGMRVSVTTVSPVAVRVKRVG